MAHPLTRARQVYILVVAVAVSAPGTSRAQSTGAPEPPRGLARVRR